MTIRCPRCAETFDWPDDEPFPAGFNEFCGRCEAELADSEDRYRHAHEQAHAPGRL